MAADEDKERGHDISSSSFDPADTGTLRITGAPSPSVYPPQETSNQKENVPSYIANDPEALEAFFKEKQNSNTYWGVARAWKMAIVWSVLFSTTIIGEGYDLALMGNFFSLRQFQSLFGSPPAPGKQPEIPALWQSSIQCATLIGQILSIYVTGLCVERYGYRKTIITALGLVIAFLFVSFFSPEALKTGGSDAGLGVLLMGEFLLGIPWGVFQATTVPYASEIAPEPLRPTLTTFIGVCWVFGQLLSTAANKVVTGIADDLASFRILVAVQWAWPLPVAICVFFAPESPWWLVRQGRSDQALKSLKRLNSDDDFPAQGTLRVIELTNEHEKRGNQHREHRHEASTASAANKAAGGGYSHETMLHQGQISSHDENRVSENEEESPSMSYRDCFRGTNRRRTEIVMMLNLTQQLCGSWLMYYLTKLYQKGGITPERAYDSTLIQYGLAVEAIAFSWPLMRYAPRRTIWISGVATSVVLMSGVGVLGLFSKAHICVPWMIATLLIMFTFAYNVTIGPLTYSLVSEMPSTRLKAKTIVLGRCTYLTAGFFNLFLVPKMLEDEPNGWGLGLRAALVFAVLDGVFLTWAWFRLPETKGRSFAEIDVLFKMGTGTRAFGKAVVGG